MRYIRLRSWTKNGSTIDTSKKPRAKSTISRKRFFKGDPNVIQVGKTWIKHPETALESRCKYSDVPTDPFGWVSDLRYLPINFDMMQLRVYEKQRIFPGWWDGKRWAGLRFKDGFTVKQWKRDLDYYDRIEHYGQRREF